MAHFKGNMHQIQFRLVLCPRPHWGPHFQHSPRQLDLGVLLLRRANWRGGKGERGKGIGTEERGGKAGEANGGKRREGRGGKGKGKEGSGEGEWFLPRLK